MFTLPGFHPTYGTKLEPVTAAIVSQYERQRQEEAKRNAKKEAARKAREAYRFIRQRL